MFGFNNKPIDFLQNFRDSNTSASDEELNRLGDFDFTFKKRKNIFGQTRSKRKSISKGITKRAVSQEDYESLINLDVFRGGDADDVTGTEIESSTFKQIRQTGEVFRTSGDELSILDEAGLERLAEVVSGRQAQIQSSNLAPGLESQAFSLLSGNFR